MMTIKVCYKKKEQAKLGDKILNIFQSKIQNNGCFNYNFFLYRIREGSFFDNSCAIQGTVI